MPPKDPSGYYFVVNGHVASWPDTYMYLVDDDGTEHPITNATGIAWHASQGTEPASATVTFANVEIDAEAEADI